MPLAIVALLLGVATAPPPDKDDASAAPPTRAVTAASPQPMVRKDDDDDDEGNAQPNTPVVITAKRLDAARTQIDAGLGSTVYSLSNDTIEDRPNGESGSIGNILTQSPGISMSGSALTIRGSSDIQIRVNNAIIPEMIGDPADHFSARLAQTTRVLTGTLPAQFGFVPAGVISITTKNGLYNHAGEIEFYGGSDGFIEPAIEWAGSALGSSLFGSASLEADRADVADQNGNQTRDRRREFGGLIFADHILGPEDRISLIVGGDDERHRFGQTSLPAGTQESADGYGVATFQHSADEFTIQASLFGGQAIDVANFGERTRERRSSVGTQIDGSYDLGAGHVLKAGILASHVGVEERDPGQRMLAEDRYSVGLYTQDEWKLSSDLTFNPGVRIDWLRGFNKRGAVEPRASFVWSPAGGFTAHLGYARYATAAPVGEVSRNASLPDEHDDYFDAGVQFRRGALTLGADAYDRRAHHFLDEYLPIGSAVPKSFAFRRASFRGFELSVTYSTRPLSAWLNVALSRGRAESLVDPGMLFAPATAAAFAHWVRLASDRPVIASGGATWRSGKIALSAMVEASSGALRSPSLAGPNATRELAYATLGLSAVYHLGTTNSRRDFRVDLTNVTDVRYRVNDASNVEGGWTRWGRGRAITLGFEQGF